MSTRKRPHNELGGLLLSAVAMKRIKDAERREEEAANAPSTRKKSRKRRKNAAGKPSPTIQPPSSSPSVNATPTPTPTPAPTKPSPSPPHDSPSPPPNESPNPYSALKFDGEESSTDEEQEGVSAKKTRKERSHQRRLERFTRPVKYCSFESGLVEGERLRLEEDTFTEFKYGLNKIDSIVKWVNRNVNAFMNTNGGTLLVGVSDEGIVTPLTMNRLERVKLLESIDGLLANWYPAPDPRLYQVSFHPAYSRKKSRALTGHVLKIHVTASSPPHLTPGSPAVYFTADHLAFVRCMASIREMTASQVARRYAQRDAVLASGGALHDTHSSSMSTSTSTSSSSLPPTLHSMDTSASSSAPSTALGVLPPSWSIS